MATIDSVATSLSSAITTANSNVATALNQLSSQLISSYGVVGAAATVETYDIPRNIDITALQTAVTNAGTAVSGIALGENTKSVLAYTTDETALWTEPFWASLKTTLQSALTVASNASVDDVISGLTNNTNVVQGAMYANDLERRQQSLRDAFSAANSVTGHDGFTYPNSMTTALQLSAQQQYIFDGRQLSRDLVTKIFEWAKSTKEFIIEKQISAHMSDAEFNLQYRRAADQAFIEEGRRLLEEYRQKMVAQIDVIEKALAALKVAVDVEQLDVTTGVQEIELSLKKYAIDLQASVAAAQTMNTANAQIAVGKLTATKDALAAAVSVAQNGANSIIGVLTA